MRRDTIPADRRLTFAMLETMAALVVLYLIAVVLAVAFDTAWYVFTHNWIVPLLATAAVAYYAVDTIRVGAKMAPGKASGREREPELYATVDRLSALLGVRPPRVKVVETDAPNALAVGLPGRLTVLCVTRGLLRRLEPVELEGAIAHELAHVAHRDTAVTSLACSVSVMGEGLSAFCREMIRDERGFNRLTFLILLGPLVGFGSGLYALGTLLTRRLSRYRELAADRSAAYLTGRPSALASALVKCSDDAARIPMTDLRAPRTVTALCLMPTPEKDFRRHPAHPPLQERIDQLAEISRRLEKGE